MHFLYPFIYALVGILVNTTVPNTVNTALKLEFMYFACCDIMSNYITYIWLHRSRFDPSKSSRTYHQLWVDIKEYACNQHI